MRFVTHRSDFDEFLGGVPGLFARQTIGPDDRVPTREDVVMEPGRRAGDLGQSVAARDRGGNQEGPPTLPRGLTTEEAGATMARVGRNDLPKPPRDPSWRRLSRHLVEPMSLLLVAAAVVAGIGLGERLEAVAILAIVVLNAVIGWLEEGRAERALDALRDLEPRRATLIRDGARRTIDAKEIVPDDLVVISAGDRVPADLRLVEATSLEIDESLLTGESLPVAKRADGTASAGAEEPVRALSGTLVVRGSGLGVVEATGGASAIGAIAAHLGGRAPSTPLQRELAGVTARLGFISILIAAGVFVLTLARMGLTEDGLQRSFLSAVALAVAAVPEGLATVVAVALALGVRRMAVRGAIVRRLPAVETLGSATVIVTDKTGTLTENRMRLDAVIPADGAPTTLAQLPPEIGTAMAEALALCSDATIDPPTGDPLEVALLEAVGADRTRRSRDAHRRVGLIPFDAARMRMTTVHAGVGEAALLHVKGAPEIVIARCTGALTARGSRPLRDAERAGLLRSARGLAEQGIRTLALARRELGRVPTDPERDERDLTFLGLVGLRDPVRPQASQAVRDARAAGIEVLMVTGDHPGTAVAIARKVGLLEGKARVVTGDAIDRGGVPAHPLDTTVYARVDPSGKLAIVESLQGGSQIVAVTGDGVNDAPALRRADIGVAMGRSGSEVAREAADMVISDDDLATIVAAVREGRGIYDNIRKVVDYLIGGNLSEISVVVGSLILFPSLGIPLLPLQLLWINLLTDGLPALALGVDPADPGLMHRPPRSATQRLLAFTDLPLLAWRALLISAAAIGTLAVARFAFDEPWAVAQSVMFSTLVVAHLLYAFTVRGGHRGRDRPKLRDLRTNRWLSIGVGLGLVLQIAITAWPAAQEVFGTVALDARAWVLVAAGGLAPGLAMAATARPEPRRPAALA